MVAFDELDELELYAERMGVELDWYELDQVREQVGQRIEEAEERAAEIALEHHMEEPDPGGEDEPDPDGEDQEIEVQFTRLAEQ